MLQRSFNSVFVSLLSVLAILGFLVFSGVGTANADPLVGAATVAIDAQPSVGGVNTSTSIGTIQNCVAIPVGGSATVEVVVDSIPVYTGLSGGLSGFGMNVLYTNTGAGALMLTAKAGPLAALDGKSLLSNNADSIVAPFTDALPDVDGNFKIVETDAGATYESGAGRLYYLTFTSVGLAGVATLDLTDSSAITGAGTAGGNDDLIPELYDGATSAYDIVPANVGDAVVYVGSPCPPTISQGFCIVGQSTGVSWQWDYGIESGTLSVASGGTAIQIASAWANSIDSSFTLLSSQLPAPNEHCFKITPGGSTLIVNGTCPVTISGCSFNPTVFLMSPIGGIAELRVNDSEGQSVASAIALAFGIGALAICLWYGRKRLFH